MVSFTFLAPLLIVGVGWLAFRLSQLVELRRLRVSCQQQLISAQQTAQSRIRELLQLNLTVRALKVERTAAEAALTAAIAAAHPPAIVRARQWVASVKTRQQTVRAYQKTLIEDGKLALMSGLLKVQRTLQGTTNENSHRTLYRLHLRSQVLSPPQMAVQKINPRENYPEYEPMRDFERKQALQMGWLAQFHPKNDEILQWMKYRLSFNESCGVTLSEKDFHIRFHQNRFF